MAVAKIVKRYANRKLYDTERSCYVTLDDIAAMIRSGEEVQVIDNKSNEDLTSVTFAQIIFETEKKRSFMPIGLLKDLIHSGGESVGDFARERVAKVQHAASDLKESAQKLREGLTTQRADGGPTEAERKGALLQVVKTSQKAFDDLQKSVEGRIKGSVDTSKAQAARVIEDIRQRLADLETRLNKF